MIEDPTRRPTAAADPRTRDRRTRAPSERKPPGPFITTPFPGRNWSVTGACRAGRGTPRS